MRPFTAATLLCALALLAFVSAKIEKAGAGETTGHCTDPSKLCLDVDDGGKETVINDPSDGALGYCESEHDGNFAAPCSFTNNGVQSQKIMVECSGGNRVEIHYGVDQSTFQAFGGASARFTQEMTKGGYKGADVSRRLREVVWNKLRRFFPITGWCRQERSDQGWRYLGQVLVNGVDRAPPCEYRRIPRDSRSDNDNFSSVDVSCQSHENLIKVPCIYLA